MPAGRQRARFRFAVAHDAADQQVRIVKHGAVGVSDGIAQLAAFMNGAGRLRRDVAGNSSGKGKLFEEPLHAFFRLLNVGIKLAVRAFKICVRDQARPAMPRPGNVNDIQVEFFNQRGSYVRK